MASDKPAAASGLDSLVRPLAGNEEYARLAIQSPSIDEVVRPSSGTDPSPNPATLFADAENDSVVDTSKPTSSLDFLIQSMTLLLVAVRDCGDAMTNTEARGHISSVYKEWHALGNRFPEMTEAQQRWVCEIGFDIYKLNAKHAEKD